MNNFNQGFNNPNQTNNFSQGGMNNSTYANQYKQQQANEMIGKFKSYVSGMNQDTLNNLITQAKKFGLSDNQINQGIDIMNSIRRGN
jgi:cation transport regulator ChaC